MGPQSPPKGQETLEAVIAQLLSHVQLLATPWMAACQASMSLTISQSLPKLIELVMPSHPLLSPSPLALNLSQYQALFQ